MAASISKWRSNRRMEFCVAALVVISKHHGFGWMGGVGLLKMAVMMVGKEGGVAL